MTATDSFQHRRYRWCLRSFRLPPIINTNIRRSTMMTGVCPVRKRPAISYSNLPFEAIMTTQGATAARIDSLYLRRSTGRIFAFLPPFVAEPPTCA